MALTNSNISYTGLVEKYVGTAYDKMSLIADNLEILLQLSEAIDNGDLGKVAEIAHLIPELLKELELFSEIYYGSAPEDPILSPSGERIREGALYFNTSLSRMKLYTENDWIILGEALKNVKVITVDSSMATKNNIAYVIPISPSYILGNNSLEVFLTREGYDGPILQNNKENDPVSGTYTERDAESIIFLASDIAIGEVVTYSSTVNSEQIMHSVEKYQEVQTITSSGISVITLSPGHSYTVGGNNIEVYKDRVLQLLGFDKDYLEISNNQIQFNTPIDGTGNPVEVILNVGEIISNAPSITTLMQETAPDVNAYAAGTEWFNTSKGRKFILYQDTDSRQWVSTNPEHGSLVEVGIPLPPSGVQDTIFSSINPGTAGRTQGTRWFNTDTGVEHILYLDGDSAQWLRVSADILGTTQ